MDEELLAAIQVNQEQLTNIALALEQDPTNEQLLEARKEFEELLALTKQMYEENRASTTLGAAAASHEQPQANNTGEADPNALIAQSSLRGRNNPKMHPNSRYYSEEPDFAALVTTCPSLADYLISTADGRAVIDFTDYNATRQLTAALLAASFGIDWWLPDGQLIPPVSNRENYIHWVNDLINLSAPPGDVRGLDVGCGASFIYCLLGAALYGWQMAGCDITDVAEQGARDLIQRNPDLAPLLEFRRSRQEQQPAGTAEQDDEAESVGGILTAAMNDDQERFHFCMCNPPFFSSREEAGRNPSTAFGGTAEEMVYPGGELAFVMRMVRDSVQLGDRIHWYTSMVGKKTTLKALRAELHALHVTALRTTELAQGKTSRWAIAWSFAASPNSASQPLQRPVNPALQAPLRAVRQVSFDLKASQQQGPKLLQALATALTEEGAACTTDQARWTVNAVLPIAPYGSEPRQQPAEAPPPQKRAKGEGGSGGGGAATAVRVTVMQQQRGSFSVVASVPSSTADAPARQFAAVMRQVQQAAAAALQ